MPAVMERDSAPMAVFSHLWAQLILESEEPCFTTVTSQELRSFGCFMHLYNGSISTPMTQARC
jgi:hypothetical protein